MQNEVITLTFNIKDEKVKKKLQKVWKSFIPLQDLFEKLLLQADLDYWKKRIGQ